MFGETLAVLVNPYAEPVDFILPPLDEDHFWYAIIDTSGSADHKTEYGGRETYPLNARTTVVLKAVSVPPEEPA
jgi:pullulanase/glycogen debranching enzyme